MSQSRILSGMRPTGRLHLGNYHGALKNWVRLQDEHECFFFVADWHALTTHYETPAVLEENVWEMVIDWLAAGIDPEKASCFVQSCVPEHAELHLLLSMITPLSWLERVPSFKDQQEKLKDKDLSTYGFLGYPLLQSADILIYRAAGVPVGEDQVPHVELTREIARRFNHMFGQGENFDRAVNTALGKMGKKAKKSLDRLRRSHLQDGDKEAYQQALDLLNAQQNISAQDKEDLKAYVSDKGRIILPEPDALLTETAKLPGLDGQKMSKSYGNTIALRDDPVRLEKALRAMPTDPARVRRTDPGDPKKCPVWSLHQTYTDAETHDWVQQGCTTAGIGCVDCKQPLIDAILAEQTHILERAEPYEKDKARLVKVIEQGNEKARAVAQETMQLVRDSVGTLYKDL